LIQQSTFQSWFEKIAQISHFTLRLFVSSLWHQNANEHRRAHFELDLDLKCVDALVFCFRNFLYLQRATKYSKGFTDSTLSFSNGFFFFGWTCGLWHSQAEKIFYLQEADRVYMSKTAVLRVYIEFI